jgi:flagellar hook protein FlgE
LEQSTVDIGEEFTKMIIIQRAFSASTRIITTADEMLDELLRTKR